MSSFVVGPWVAKSANSSTDHMVSLLMNSETASFSRVTLSYTALAQSSVGGMWSKSILHYQLPGILAYSLDYFSKYNRSSF